MYVMWLNCLLFVSVASFPHELSPQTGGETQHELIGGVKKKEEVKRDFFTRCGFALGGVTRRGVR